MESGGSGNRQFMLLWCGDLAIADFIKDGGESGGGGWDNSQARKMLERTLKMHTFLFTQCAKMFCQQSFQKGCTKPDVAKIYQSRENPESGCPPPNTHTHSSFDAKLEK